MDIIGEIYLKWNILFLNLDLQFNIFYISENHITILKRNTKRLNKIVTK